MKALILAAGEAKRLRPLTNETPKCLLTLDGKAIIDYQIENLLKAGVSEAVVVTGFQAEKLESYLTTTHQNVSFTFIRSDDYYKTYPAHGLWLAKEHLLDDSLYLNADVVCHPDIIKKILADSRGSVTAIQRNPWDEEEVNVILENDSSNVAEMGKVISKNLSDGEFIGVTKITKEFGTELIKTLDTFIESGELKKFAADAINLTIQRGQVMFALDVSDLPAIEIDTPEDFKQAESTVASIKF